jgi:D-amino-acid dehydrogenase
VRSVERTWELGETLGLDYDASDVGTLKIFDSRDEMGEALLIAKLLETQGLDFRVLDADEVVGVEPQLADVRSRIAGGIHFPDDRCGDANLFTHALAEEAVRLGAEIRRGVSVSRVLTEADRVTGVATNQGRLPTRRVVLAAAHASVGLARRVGVRLPIKPVKGYSLTFEVRNAPRPRIAVIDEAMHAAVVPLGERLRVVGTAEFTGHDMRLHPRRIENLEQLFARLYPALVSHIDAATTVAWTGLRPVTPDGLPHVGASRVAGLWINSGHGHLGWTMAVGSAGLLVDLMLDKTPEVDPQPFRVGR